VHQLSPIADLIVILYNHLQIGFAVGFPFIQFEIPFPPAVATHFVPGESFKFPSSALYAVNSTPATLL